MKLWNYSHRCKRHIHKGTQSIRGVVRWAQKARLSWHPSSPTAYERAISLLQDSLAFTPTLEVQHHHLVARRDHYEKLPLNYASYQAQIGRVKEAIETLERGSSLLWSEMREFRTSIDQVLMVDSCLAEKFAAVHRDLEALTTSGSPDILTGDGEVDGGVVTLLHWVVVTRHTGGYGL